VYKKALRNYPYLKSDLKLLIISAKYGLIEDSELISFYDLKMNSESASRQQNNNTSKLQALIERDHPQSLTVVMGKTYMQSIDLSEIRIPIKTINGEIGSMLHGLKEWLGAISRGDFSAY
jgi:hypothetical protein